MRTLVVLRMQQLEKEGGKRLSGGMKWEEKMKNCLTVMNWNDLYGLL